MSIISKETFDRFSEEEKKKIRELYKIELEYSSTINWSKTRVENMENIFGKENLQPEPIIKTWEDVERVYPNIKEEVDSLNRSITNCLVFDNKIDAKLKAIIKIQKLIELGYGGVVSKEEWLNEENPKSVIKCTTDIKPRLYNDTVYDDIQFVAFHTDKQRNEFMSYPENRTLVEQYYMI